MPGATGLRKRRLRVGRVGCRCCDVGGCRGGELGVANDGVGRLAADGRRLGLVDVQWRFCQDGIDLGAVEITTCKQGIRQGIECAAVLGQQIERDGVGLVQRSTDRRSQVLEQQKVVRRFIANTNQSVRAQSERLLKLGCQSGSPGKIALAMLALDTSDLRHEARDRWRAAIRQHLVGPAGVADHPDPTEVEHAAPVMVPVNP